jgi:hypothetical protein
MDGATLGDIIQAGVALIIGISAGGYTVWLYLQKRNEKKELELFNFKNAIENKILEHSERANKLENKVDVIILNVKRNEMDLQEIKQELKENIKEMRKDFKEFIAEIRADFYKYIAEK